MSHAFTHFVDPLDGTTDDLLANFNGHLADSQINQRGRGAYFRHMENVLELCEERGIDLAQLDDEARRRLADELAREARFNVWAALDFWFQCWGSDAESMTGVVSHEWRPALSVVDDEPADESPAFDDVPGEAWTETFDMIEAEIMNVAETEVVSYERYLVSIGLATNTLRAYSARLRFAQGVLAEMGANLDSADAHQLAGVAARVPNTHSMRGQLRVALKHYYDWKNRRDAPLRAVRVPPQPKMVNRALDSEEASALLDTARGRWPKGGAVVLGLYLGLRRTEIARAEWERFDETMEWYTVTGKYDKTVTLPVHQAIRDEMEPHRGTGYIFPGRPGVRDHVSPSTIWSWVKELAIEAGIGKITPHQLRHTCLTTALDNTGDLRTVMEFARHEKPETTTGYTRTTKQQLRRASDALDFMQSPRTEDF